MSNLQMRIIEAFEKGDTALLKELQRQYRAGVVCSGDRGPTMPMRVVETTAPIPTPSRKNSRPRPPWHLPHGEAHTRTAAETLTVEVSSAARTAMADRAFDKRRDLVCGWEAAAGVLYGRGLSVLYAGTAGATASDGAVEIDFSAAREEERVYGCPLIGDWHAHPSRRGPSKEDLLGWMDTCRVRGAPHVGLLLYSESLDWTDATISAWVALRRDGRIVVEPAHIHEGRT